MSSPTNENFVTGLRGFLNQHLFTLIVGAALIYSNFSAAQASSETYRAEFEKRIDRLEAKIDKIYEQGLAK